MTAYDTLLRRIHTANREVDRWIGDTVMTTAILLRITSAISFLLAAGHTLGGWSSWSPVGDTDVLTSMRTFQFQTVV